MKKTALMIVTAFVSGVVLGANRPIRKFLSPAVNAGGERLTKTYNFVLKFAVKRKEQIEDLVAEARMGKLENKKETTIVAS
jgi:hypothetical protein